MQLGTDQIVWNVCIENGKHYVATLGIRTGFFFKLTFLVLRKENIKLVSHCCKLIQEYVFFPTSSAYNDHIMVFLKTMVVLCKHGAAFVLVLDT